MSPVLFEVWKWSSMYIFVLQESIPRYFYLWGFLPRVFVD